MCEGTFDGLSYFIVGLGYVTRIYLFPRKK